MKCFKCNGENFVLETTIVKMEKYKIYKNGRIAQSPTETEIVDEDMTDNENIIRCVNCGQGYVLEKCRKELLNEINFNKVDLEIEGHLTKY